ncbi:GPI anchored serine-threonine rich family protein [Streptomyces europaeiscabiei]|uniref:GPI anchored serine-threonine rich family protein n=1 Tax=Streptomyces europaeiscabiei TaxID=146819 RepID=UPI002E2ABB27|nr:GPI anchored serine-threonine rich family protein [Streptomyces europaeiscabiei]
METLTTARRRPHLVLAAAVLALVYSAITGVTQPQPAAAAAKFSQPITNSVWRAGEPQDIVWSDATPGSQPLRLMRGSATALQQVMEIAVVDGASSHYKWVVPADLPTDNTYAIALGSPPDAGYTGQFTITQSVPSPIGERHPAPAPTPGPARPQPGPSPR